jgi:hypothetical protein
VDLLIVPNTKTAYRIKNRPRKEDVSLLQCLMKRLFQAKIVRFVNYLKK